jgi:chromate transporter
MTDDPRSALPPRLADATRVWFRIGCLSFGGAAAQIAMLHRVIVDERRWVPERRFLDALNYCTLLPGPEAQQLATYLGFILHGVRGGVIAGALFVLPGALLMLGLSALYVLGQNTPLLTGIFLGIKAAVIAIVIEALLRISKRGLKTWFLLALAAVSFVLLAFFGVDFPVVVLGAGLIGAVLAGARPDLIGVGATEVAVAPLGRAQVRAAFVAAAVFLAIWWAPVLLAGLTLGTSHILTDVGLFFSKLAMLTFGGAYAVLAWLTDAAVNDKGWLTAAEMIDGLGLAETTPGPTILVNQFAAFLAGWRAPAPFSPPVMATLTALMAVWVTFAPSFVWIFAGAPFVERVRANRRLAGALQAITAAVVGVIASLLLTFTLGVLFGGAKLTAFGPLTLPVPALSGFNLTAFVLAGIAGVLLLKLHRGVIETVVVMGALGVAVTLVRPMLGL